MTFAAARNQVDDGDAAIELTGTPSLSGLAAATTTVTVTDDDDPAVSVAAPALAAGGGHVFEHEGTLEAGQWVLKRTGTALEAVTVNVAVSETGSGSFAAMTTATVAFAEGVAEARFDALANDASDEPHGTVTVTVTTGAGYVPATSGRSATAAVRDDDGPLVTFAVDPLERTVAEGRRAAFSAALATVTDGTFTHTGDFGRVLGGTGIGLQWSTLAVGEATTADFTAVDVARTFPFASFSAAGGGYALRQALPPVSALADDADDPGERFVVKLARQTGTSAQVVPASRSNDATLVEGGSVVALSGADFFAAVARIHEGSTLTLEAQPSIAEGGTTTVTASVSPTRDAPFTVTVAAPSSARYSLTGTTLSFAADAPRSRGTVTLRAVDNSEDDGDVDVVLTGTPSVTDVAVGRATVTVTDDDDPTVTIAGPPLAADDGYVFEHERALAGAQWVLTRTGAAVERLEVDVTVADAAVGGDFAADGAATVVFAAGVDEVRFAPIVDDGADETHGTVTVTLADGTGYTVGSPAAASAPVRDDDGPLIRFAVAPLDPLVAEGQRASFTAVLTTVADGTFTVAADFGRLYGGAAGVDLGWSTQAVGEATAGTDYIEVDTTETFMFSAFAAGSAGFALRQALPPVSVRTDATADPGERLLARLATTAGTPPTVVASMRAPVADLLDGGTPRPLSGAGFYAAVVTIHEGWTLTLVATETLAEGGQTPITATLEPLFASAFTVTISAPASPRYRFAAGNLTLSFAARSKDSTGTVTLEAVANTEDDGDIDVTVTGAASHVDVPAGQVTVKITDDDDPTVSVAGPTLATGGYLFENEAAADGAGWVVTRDGKAPDALDVTVTVTETRDFVESADEGTVTVAFAEGASAATLTPLDDDGADERHGTVTVQVQSGSGYVVDGANGSAAVAVRDDDGAFLTADLTPREAEVLEGTAAVFTASLAADATVTALADFARVLPGTTSLPLALATADIDTTAGDDYFAPSPGGVDALIAEFELDGTDVVWRKTLPGVETRPDDLDETNERFVVRLTRRTGTPSAVGGTPATITGYAARTGDLAVASATIVDGPAVTLTVATSPLPEGQSTTVSATVDPMQAQAFTVTVSASALDGGNDRFEFVGANRTLSFALNAASSTGTVTVRATANEAHDGNVDVRLTGTPDRAGVTRGSLILEIVDDDLPEVSIAAPVAAKGGYLFEHESAADGAGAWTVTRVGLTTEPLAVELAVSETGAGDFVADDEERTHTVTIPADAASTSFDPIIRDGADEKHNRVTVTVSATADYEVGAATAAVDVRDDDGTFLTAALEPSVQSVGKGASVAVRATLTTDDTVTVAGDLVRLHPMLTGIGLRWDTREIGSATAGADYTGPTAATAVTVPFSGFVAAGTPWGVSLPGIATLDDGSADDMERFVVRLYRAMATPDSVGGTPSPVADYTDDANVVELSVADVTIREGPTLTLVLTPPTIAEGDGDADAGQTIVTATLSPVASNAFRVTVSGGLPRDRYEFADSQRYLSFAAEATDSTGLVRLRAVPNDVQDGDAEVTVTGTPNEAGAAQGIASVRSTLTVVDDDLPLVSLAPPTAAVGGYLFEHEAAGAGAGAWTVTRDGLLEEALEVSVTVADTGTGDGDFVADGALTLTIEATAASVAFDPVVDDMIDEAHGEVTVSVQSATAYDADPDADEVALELRDDDGPALEVWLGPSDAARATRDANNDPLPYDLTVSEGTDAALDVVVRSIDDRTLTAPGDFERLTRHHGVLGHRVYGRRRGRGRDLRQRRLPVAVVGDGGGRRVRSRDRRRRPPGRPIRGRADQDGARREYRGDPGGDRCERQGPDCRTRSGAALPGGDGPGVGVARRARRAGARRPGGDPASRRRYSAGFPSVVTLREGPADGRERLVMGTVQFVGKDSCRAYDPAVPDVEGASVDCPELIQGRVEVTHNGEWGHGVRRQLDGPRGPGGVPALGLQGIRPVHARPRACRRRLGAAGPVLGRDQDLAGRPQLPGHREQAGGLPPPRLGRAQLPARRGRRRALPRGGAQRIRAGQASGRGHGPADVRVRRA